MDTNEWIEWGITACSNPSTSHDYYNITTAYIDYDDDDDRPPSSLQMHLLKLCFHLHPMLIRKSLHSIIMGMGMVCGCVRFYVEIIISMLKIVALEYNASRCCCSCSYMVSSHQSILIIIIWIFIIVIASLCV